MFDDEKVATPDTAEGAEETTSDEATDAAPEVANAEADVSA